ncbi:rom1p [Saccharomyces arboricola H-6]|uniref:Rom1p n=1 Tax=Saccharomyces arboricola (strain H-6 / AS 2.3317 / CBS 10644) TaxID=1160507 RepID=J8Q7W1_SACAR|nr:rom1p [Saccharomyces arboricola H-6]
MNSNELDLRNTYFYEIFGKKRKADTAIQVQQFSLDVQSTIDSNAAGYDIGEDENSIISSDTTLEPGFNAQYKTLQKFPPQQSKKSLILRVSTNFSPSSQSFTNDPTYHKNKIGSIRELNKQDKKNTTSTTPSPSQKRPNILLPCTRKNSSPSILSLSQNNRSQNSGYPNQLSTPPTPKSAEHTTDPHDTFHRKSSSSSTSSAFALESLKNQNTRSPNSSNHSNQYQRHSSHHRSHHSRSKSSPTSLSETSLIKGTPLIYPALLSRIAIKFKQTIQLNTHKKMGLLYRDSFTGKQAIDTLCLIIGTLDRNLGLLVGKSLEVQKLFHDVLYDHGIRDSVLEVYELSSDSLFVAHQLQSFTSIANTFSSSSSLNSVDTKTDVNGVFVPLSYCYSSTCSLEKLCYSISCPNRLQQQSNLHLKLGGGLKRNISLALDKDDDERVSWTNSVSKSISESLPKKQIKRQEAIYELFTTEKKFVKSLEIIRDTFMKKLLETNIIPSDVRINFVKHVFAHVNEIHSVNREFLKALAQRQALSPICPGISDIFLQYLPFFDSFLSYIASRPYAKYLIETQRSINPNFARFDDEVSNSSLRHGIDSFLSQGVSRPGRYSLLVREIINSSDPVADKDDLQMLMKVQDLLKDLMKRIDRASGAAQDRYDVKALKQKILFKNEYVNLGLNDERRRIKHEGLLSRKDVNKADASFSGDIQFYLLDNMLLFLKSKAVNKWHQHTVFQRPIPLPLLFICPTEDTLSIKRYVTEHPNCSAGLLSPQYQTNNSKNAITFAYYGTKQQYQVILYAPQLAGLQTLMEKVKQEQQRYLDETKQINFEQMIGQFFHSYINSNHINDVFLCSSGKVLLVATNLGLYVLDYGTPVNTKPIHLLHKFSISQISVLDEYRMIIILIDKKLYGCPLDIIYDTENADYFFKKNSKVLLKYVAMFKDGVCNDKRIILVAHHFLHMVKLLNVNPLIADFGSGSFKKNLKASLFEFSVDSEPLSFSFLEDTICIGCKKNIKILNIPRVFDKNAFKMREFLNPHNDDVLSSLYREAFKVISIFPVKNLYFICFPELGFFLNRQGKREETKGIIHWEGEAEQFACCYPYILAINNSFIEIRDLESGELARCVLGNKINMLRADTRKILYSYEDSQGFEIIESLNF